MMNTDYIFFVRRLTGALTLGLVFLSCNKEKFPEASYTGKFLGYDKLSATKYDVLDIALELTESSKNKLVFNQSIILTKVNDSIKGTFVLPNESYLIHPYLIGTWQKEKKAYVITGDYAAVKDSWTMIQGTFEIRQNK